MPVRSELAQLLLPAIRWDPDRGYDGARSAIAHALDMGVGGFILFGGDQEGVRALTKELRAKSRHPLLIGADLERGAGQQFAGCAGLPPLAAIASLNDPDLVRRAARLTAREARTIGVNWDYAPVCDLDVLPENPIVGTRSLGSNPAKVAELAVDWIDACQAEGVLACAKHFPGHGRTRGDSHAELPVVDASTDTLMESDLVPFRAAIDAGVGSIMTAHVSFPALDPSGLPATRSREILQWLLRRQLGYDGLVVTDALIMEGALAGTSEGDAAVGALRAGCDLLLYPNDLEAVTRALDEAMAKRVLDREQTHQSIRRRMKYAQWVSPPNEYRRPSQTDLLWGASLCDRVVHAARGSVPRVRWPLDVLVVDDDTGGPYPPPSRQPFLDGLRAGGEVRLASSGTGAAGSTLIVAVFGDIRSWKGRPGYSADTRAAVARALEEAKASARDAIVVQFSHPRLLAELPTATPALSAWGGEKAMQEAAARRVVKS
jgi:beta-glucosidase